MSKLILFRRGHSPSPEFILKDGEPGFDLATGEFKIGRGGTRWGDLPSYGVVTSAAVAQAVAEWLEVNPIAGVTAQYVSDALNAHKAEATPHKAYDVDIQSLTVLFENGLV